jgi:hypothetical protein
VWAAALRLGLLAALLSSGIAAARGPRAGGALARRERLVALGASAAVAGPLWGLALGFALTRRIARRHRHPDEGVVDPALVRSADEVALATRVEGAQVVQGVLALDVRGLAFVPERRYGGQGVIRVPWNALRAARVVVVGRWLAELLGASAHAVELDLGDKSVRFAVPRAARVLTRIEAARAAHTDEPARASQS